MLFQLFETRLQRIRSSGVKKVSSWSRTSIWLRDDTISRYGKPSLLLKPGGIRGIILWLLLNLRMGGQQGVLKQNELRVRLLMEEFE